MTIGDPGHVAVPITLNEEPRGRVQGSCESKGIYLATVIQKEKAACAEISPGGQSTKERMGQSGHWYRIPNGFSLTGYSAQKVSVHALDVS